ncbi:MAG TPA: DNA translocase FtsK 4TM domain-containing protein, partial [Flavobacterium sp.]|nr:DNA translocase FtsK 4TM domain-containing protein [Flavobacterium sp.]
MARTTKKETAGSTDSQPKEKKPWKLTRQHKVILGALLVIFSIALLLAFISFFIYGQYDQSAVGYIADRTVSVQNWLGKLGAYLADIFLYQGFGVASFLMVRLFFITGMYLVLDLPVRKLKNTWFWDLFIIIITSILFGFFASFLPELGGVIGFEMNLFIQDYLGKAGTLLVLAFGLIIYLIFKLKISPDSIKNYFEAKKREAEERALADAVAAPPAVQEITEDLLEEDEDIVKAGISPDFYSEDEEELEEPTLKPVSQFEINKELLKPTITNSSQITLEPVIKAPPAPIPPAVHQQVAEIIETDDEAFVIEKF